LPYDGCCPTGKREVAGVSNVQLSEPKAGERLPTWETMQPS